MQVDAFAFASLIADEFEKQRSDYDRVECSRLSDCILGGSFNLIAVAAQLLEGLEVRAK